MCYLPEIHEGNVRPRSFPLVVVSACYRSRTAEQILVKFLGIYTKCDIADLSYL